MTKPQDETPENLVQLDLSPFSKADLQILSTLAQVVRVLHLRWAHLGAFPTGRAPVVHVGRRLADGHLRLGRMTAERRDDACRGHGDRCPENGWIWHHHPHRPTTGKGSKAECPADLV